MGVALRDQAYEIAYIPFLYRTKINKRLSGRMRRNHLPRSAPGADWQTRPRAPPLASVFQACPSGKAPSMSEVTEYVTEIGTIVKGASPRGGHCGSNAMSLQSLRIRLIEGRKVWGRFLESKNACGCCGDLRRSRKIEASERCDFGRTGRPTARTP